MSVVSSQSSVAGKAHGVKFQASKLQASREAPRTKFHRAKTCGVRPPSRGFDAPRRLAVRSKETEQALGAPAKSNPVIVGPTSRVRLVLRKCGFLAGSDFDQIRLDSTKFDHFLFFWKSRPRGTSTKCRLQLNPSGSNRIKPSSRTASNRVQAGQTNPSAGISKVQLRAHIKMRNRRVARDLALLQGARRKNILMDPRPTSNAAAAPKIGNPEGCFLAGIWLRCSSVRERCGYLPSSRLARRPPENSAPIPHFDMGSKFRLGRLRTKPRGNLSNFK